MSVRESLRDTIVSFGGDSESGGFSMAGNRARSVLHHHHQQNYWSMEPRIVHGTMRRRTYGFFFFFFEPARRPPTGRGGYRLPFKARFKIESILNRGSKFKFRIQYFHGIHQFK